jgi:hypothetical protein
LDRQNSTRREVLKDNRASRELLVIWADLNGRATKRIWRRLAAQSRAVDEDRRPDHPAKSARPGISRVREIGEVCEDSNARAANDGPREGLHGVQRDRFAKDDSHRGLTEVLGVAGHAQLVPSSHT